jgi:methylaspartate mutase sigma subunit
MGFAEKKKATLVTGVIGDDVHITGIKILERALKEARFEIVSLGIQVSQEEFIRAALETKADAILVSSLGGHAKLLSEGFRSKCSEAGLKDILLYIGGNLSIGEPWEDVEKTFKGFGFDRAYPPFTLPKPVISDLEADLVNKKK